MCGINGIYAYARSTCVDADELDRTRDLMMSRGPDGAGSWLSADRAIGLGHRRLALLDLSSSGAQPMASADGRFVITFNGEIYNFMALRADLEARGHVFASRSDTEVILHLYRQYGRDMLPRLRGMFAFGLWDKGESRLLLARDPYGIKPLYWANAGGVLRFASSVKALIGSGAVARDPEPAGLVGFDLFGSVPEPWTTFKAVAALPAGSSLMIGADGPGTPVPYWSIADRICAAEETSGPTARRGADLGAFVRDTLLDSVRRHLVADVPIGAFLSGGVDSGALVGLMRDAGQAEIRTVTLAFDPFRGSAADETVNAGRVAMRYGTRHTTRRVGREEFLDDLPRILAAMDQPTIDGINTWFVAKATRELGLKAAVSGIGGDELLGGYSTFGRLPRLVRILRRMPRMPSGLRPAARLLSLLGRAGMPLHPKAAGLCLYGRDTASAYLLQRSVYLPFELEGGRDPAMVRDGLERLQPLDLIARALRPMPRTAFGSVCVLESALYLRNQLLRDADWAGMAHSIEIRTPLVDATVLEALAPAFAVSAPPDGKALLADAPALALPRETVDRPKTGFQIPVRAFLEPSGETPTPARLWSRRWSHLVSEWTAPSPATEATRSTRPR